MNQKNYKNYLLGLEETQEILQTIYLLGGKSGLFRLNDLVEVVNLYVLELLYIKVYSRLIFCPISNSW